MLAAEGIAVDDKDVVAPPVDETISDGTAIAVQFGRPLELSVAVGPDRPALVALTDGMGGHAAGDTAARIAADQLTRSVPTSSDEFREVFLRADDAIHVAASGDSAGMGCAAAAVLIYASGLVVIANLGDVRAYRVVDGYLGQVTVDDRPQTAPGSPPTGTVTRWLGGRRRTVVEPHFYELTVRPGDRFVLCTDGLHDVVSPSADHGFAAGGGRSVAGDLVQSAVTNDGDNVTVVVLDMVGHSAENRPIREMRSEIPPDVVANLSGIIAQDAEASNPPRHGTPPARRPGASDA